jgi:menaquinone-dependent protoporphyrinogen oxidase
MAVNVLVAYASKHGTTREVAESIASTLRERGLAVDTDDAARVGEVTRYDAVVVGGGLYMGRWHADARRLLKRHRRELAETRLAVFGMGPDSLDESKVAESRRQLERALALTPELTPVAVAIFGGALEPENWPFPFNRLPAFDARDWGEVTRWADDLAATLVPAAISGARQPAEAAGAYFTATEIRRRSDGGVRGDDRLSA